MNEKLKATASKDAQATNNVAEIAAQPQTAPVAETITSRPSQDSAVNAFPTPTTKSKQRGRKKDLHNSTILKARKAFKYQILKSNELKLQCLKTFIGSDGFDAEKFWLNYRDSMELILDSKRFENECVAKNLKPEIVAEHLVFEGKTRMNEVIKYGLSILGNEVELYKETFLGNTISKLKS